MNRLPLQDVVSTTSGWLNLLGLALYAVFTWRALHSPQEEKPLRFAWLLWVLLSITYLSYQLSTGVPDGLPLLVSELIGLTVIFLLTLRYGGGSLAPKSWSQLIPGQGYWTQLMEKREWFGLGVAVVALALWFEVRVAILTLGLSLFVDWMAASPTIIQASKGPGIEPWYAWSLNAVASAGTIYSLIHNGPWLQMIYSASLFAMSMGVIVADQVARFKFRKAAMTYLHVTNLREVTQPPPSTHEGRLMFAFMGRSSCRLRLRALP